MARKTKNKKNLLIIVLVVLLMLLAVGYAAFSDILKVSGTANAKGTFDLEFQNAETIKVVGANVTETKLEISQTKNDLVVKVSELAYPGAGVEFSVDIVNVGTIPAKVNKITEENISGNDVIKISGLDVITEEHPIIEPDGVCNIHFTVEWPQGSDAILGSEGAEAEFKLGIEYVQDTGEIFDGKASHDGVLSDGTIVTPTPDPEPEPIEKVDPEYTLPTGLKANVGDTLADVSLDAFEGFTWKDPSTPVGAAGLHKFSATYTPEDTDTYNIVDVEISVGVEKLILVGIEELVPTDLQANAGSKLADVKFADTHFSWEEPETNVGTTLTTNNYKAEYTPDDIDTYEIVKDIDVPIEVIKTGNLSQTIDGYDYGKSINYSVTVLGQQVNKWSVFHNDGTNVYLILDDFLPNTLVPSATGLSKSGTYGVYYPQSGTRDNLLKGLNTTSYWADFAKGVSGATATGAPTNELFVASWNANPAVNSRKLQTNVIYSPEYNETGLETATSLYLSHTEEIDGCKAYWVSTAIPGNAYNVFHMAFHTCLCDAGFHRTYCGVRPVVKLPTNATGTIRESGVEINK